MTKRKCWELHHIKQYEIHCDLCRVYPYKGELIRIKTNDNQRDLAICEECWLGDKNE